MIVFEMSSDYTIILPLMVCVVIASLLGRRLLRYTIYEMKLLRRGIDWQRVRRPRFLSRVPISAIERKPAIVAQPGETVIALAQRLTGDDELVIPICDGQRFVGIMRTSDLARAIGNGGGGRTVGSLARVSSEVLTRDDTVERAATLMADGAIPLLPVVDQKNQTLLGIVTRRDVLQSYRGGPGKLD